MAEGGPARRGRGPTRCLDILKLRPGEKFNIDIDELGQPIGPNASKLASFCGTLARDGRVIPLNRFGWREVTDREKDRAWSLVKEKFEVEERLRDVILQSINKKWRDYKSDLKQNHYDPYETNAERINHRPPDVVEDQWAIIVEYWNSQNAQNLSARNKTNRANQTLNHTAGTKSFARVRNEQGLAGRAETFIKTHTRKDGTPINDEAADKIDQMRTIIEQGTPDSTARDDIYTQVMGHDTHGRVRCCGLGHTPTRLWGGSASSSTSSQYVDMDEFNRMREQLQRTEERLEEEMRQRQTIEATVAQHTREFEEFRNFMMNKRQTQSPGETSANDSPPRDFS